MIGTESGSLGSRLTFDDSIIVLMGNAMAVETFLFFIVQEHLPKEQAD